MVKSQVYGIALVILTAPSWLAGQSAVQTFSMSPGGASTFAAVDSGSAVNTGFATVMADSGSAVPEAFTTLQFHNGGTLISETVVPASLKVYDRQRFFVEVHGSVNTGLAIANPNSGPATILFGFQDPAIPRRLGLVGEGSITIPPHSQIASFIDQPPFNFPGPYAGMISVSSSVPVALTVIRGLTNERSEFLITTIVDGEPPQGTFQAVPVQPTVIAGFIPRFAVGGGWTTEIVLINEGPQDFASVTIEFVGPSGEPVPVQINGETAASFVLGIPFREFVRIMPAGQGPEIRAGYVRVIANAHTAPFHGFAMYSFENSGIKLSTASVPLVQPGHDFSLFVEQSGGPGNVQTGIAISNPAPIPSFVSLELLNLRGQRTGISGISIPSNGQFAKFLSEIPGFESVPAEFRGVLRVSTASSGGVTVAGIRGHLNERLDYVISSLLPAALSERGGGETAIPQIVQGGGYYSSEVVLINNSTQNSSGVIHSIPNLSLKPTSP
jgi:hypothetical protein